MKTERFITLEGGEGSGKTTASKLLKEKLEKLGYEVVLTREPGGSSFSEKVRNLIMECDLNIEEEALLFAAARVNHIKEVIIPALNEEKFVICDRYVDSSIVYQSYVGECKNVYDYNRFAYENCMPNKTFFFDIVPEKALKRLEDNNREKNRFDKKGIKFHQKIYEGYKQVIQNEKRFTVLDATKTTEELVEEIMLTLGIRC